MTECLVTICGTSTEQVDRAKAALTRVFSKVSPVVQKVVFSDEALGNSWPQRETVAAEYADTGRVDLSGPVQMSVFFQQAGLKGNVRTDIGRVLKTDKPAYYFLLDSAF